MELEVKTQRVVEDEDVDLEEWLECVVLLGDFDVEVVVEALEVGVDDVDESVGDLLVDEVDLVLPLLAFAGDVDLLGGRELLIVDLAQFLLNVLALGEEGVLDVGEQVFVRDGARLAFVDDDAFVLEACDDRGQVGLDRLHHVLD